MQVVYNLNTPKHILEASLRQVLGLGCPSRERIQQP